MEEAEEINPVRFAKLLTPRVPATVMEEEACKAPAICKGPAIVEEAEEISPVFKLAKPATDKVLEAETGPETFNELAIVEEPRAIKPPRLVNLPASLSTPASKVEKIKIP